MKGQNLLMHQRHSNWPFLMWDWMFKVSADGRWVIFSLARKIKKDPNFEALNFGSAYKMKWYLITYSSVSVKRQKKGKKIRTCTATWALERKVIFYAWHSITVTFKSKDLWFSRTETEFNTRKKMNNFCFPIRSFLKCYSLLCFACPLNCNSC